MPKIRIKKYFAKMAIPFFLGGGGGGGGGGHFEYHSKLTIFKDGLTQNIEKKHQRLCYSLSV